MKNEKITIHNGFSPFIMEGVDDASQDVKVDDGSNMPLVSIGLPVYDRPELLREALESLTRQSYTNLEIIISDDCSPGTATQMVINEFAQRDHRIQNIRQEINLGRWLNHKFVLKHATGRYFLWASEDDKWDKNFIQVCVDGVLNHDVGSVMTNYKVVYTSKGIVEDRSIPLLSDEFSIVDNFKTFLENIRPVFFHGLHLREDILIFDNIESFDWDDVYLVIRQILYNNFLTIPDQQLFYSGINTEHYIYKPAHPKKGRLFEYRPLITHVLQDLWVSRKLSLFQKVQTTFIFIKRMMGLFITYENKARPLQVALIRLVFKLINFPNLVKIKIKSRLRE